MTTKRPEAIIFDALRGIVENRVYPGVFTLKADTPKWPAIRYLRVSTSPPADIEGDGGDETADVTMQIDAVAKSWAEMVELRRQVKEEMASVTDMPVLWTGETDIFDEPTRTYRCQLSYDFHPSSEYYEETGETGT